VVGRTGWEVGVGVVVGGVLAVEGRRLKGRLMMRIPRVLCGVARIWCVSLMRRGQFATAMLTNSHARLVYATRDIIYGIYEVHWGGKVMGMGTVLELGGDAAIRLWARRGENRCSAKP
jgi:hypothetical protein